MAKIPDCKTGNLLIATSRNTVTEKEVADFLLPIADETEAREAAAIIE